MMSFTKIVQDPFFLAPVLTNEILGKVLAPNIKLGPYNKKTEECRTSPSEFCLPFFIGDPLHACFRRKMYVSPYGCPAL